MLLSVAKKRPLPRFGANLRRLRLAAGLSQAALGETVGMPQTLIARMENNPAANPTWETLLKLADALGVTLDKFTDDPAT